MTTWQRVRRGAVALASLSVLLLGCNASAPVSRTPGQPSAAPSPGAAATQESGGAGATANASVAPASGSAATAPTLPFTPGTSATPRVVSVTADDRLNFVPGLVQVAVGETVTFRIHNVGKAVHEFKVGPLAEVFADKESAPEVADIDGGKTAELTYTFHGVGPFAFACHIPGHFEHGMAGYIQLVGPGAPTIGTKANPRIVGVAMNDALEFVPDRIEVAKGETIRFVLMNVGKAVHEFQVGPAGRVAADQVDGVIVVEKDELDAGSTHAVDYTLSGDGPYAFACHEPGHYEAGMKGTIVPGG